jgi:hypothetical protein
VDRLTGLNVIIETHGVGFVSLERDPLAHPFLAYTSALTHLLTFGSKRDEARAVGFGGKTGPSYLISYRQRVAVARVHRPAVLDARRRRHARGHLQEGSEV